MPTMDDFCKELTTEKGREQILAVAKENWEALLLLITDDGYWRELIEKKKGNDKYDFKNMSPARVHEIKRQHSYEQFLQRKIKNGKY